MADYILACDHCRESCKAATVNLMGRVWPVAANASALALFIVWHGSAGCRLRGLREDIDDPAGSYPEWTAENAEELYRRRVPRDQ